MSTFELAIPIVLKHEGIFSDNPNDPGGATKYGVSLRWLKSLGDNDGVLQGDLDWDGDVDINDIKNMTLAQATELYRVQWWDKYRYGLIKDQALATKVFDAAVNMGEVQAHKLLQRACWSIDGYGQIEDDGILGKKTLDFINTSTPPVISPYKSEIAGFYRALVALKPSRGEFINGWLRRAYS